MTGDPLPGASSAPVSRQTVRSWDRRAGEVYGVPGIVLMENAALGCDRVIGGLLESEPRRFAPPFRIVCGPGNNGGDGLALARHLRIRGLGLSIHLVEPRARVKPGSDAAVNLAIAERMGLEIHEPDPRRPPELAALATAGGVVVDAMLGTGLDRPLRPPYLEWVQAINSSGLSVIAIDIPTGLDADTGEVLGAAVRAGHTITMAAAKLGFGQGAGPEHTGKVHVVGIGVPRELLERPVT